MSRRSCLIIGAGMAGLAAARMLKRSGYGVTIVEESTVPGGRIATREVDGARFDIGAQYFSARDPRMAELAKELEEAQVIRPWFATEGSTRYCGIDGMDRIPAYLARDLDVRTSTPVVHIEPRDNIWAVRAADGEKFEADTIILTPPPEQSLALCEPFRPLLGRKLVQTLQSLHYEPCYALMVMTEQPSLVPEPGFVRPEEGLLTFIADHTKKGVSSEKISLTLLATPRFTTNHWDDDTAYITEQMLRAAEEWIPGEVITTQLHRWRYSHPNRVEETRYIASRCPSRLIFAGDAFGGAHVEGAFLSGLAAAEKMMDDAW